MNKKWLSFIHISSLTPEGIADEVPFGARDGSFFRNSNVAH
jgi:hypothetical protein